MNGLARGDLRLPINHSGLASHTVYGRIGCSFCDLMVDNNKSSCIFTICLGLFEETVTGRLKCYNLKYNIAGTNKVFLFLDQTLVFCQFWIESDINNWYNAVIFYETN